MDFKLLWISYHKSQRIRTYQGIEKNIYCLMCFNLIRNTCTFGHLNLPASNAH